MASPILWQNKEQTITLLDVPRSIAAAQSTNEFPCHDILLSSEPLQAPFPTNEPKSEKAKAKLKGNTVDDELHVEYQSLLEQALRDVRAEHQGDWCFPRPFTSASTNDIPAKKRHPNERIDANTLIGSRELPQDCVWGCLAAEPEHSEYTLEILPKLPGRSIRLGEGLAVQSAEYSFQKRRNIRSMQFYSDFPAALSIKKDDREFQIEHYIFRLPPRATAFFADCTNSKAFHEAVRQRAQDQDTRRHFDFILLDPPWPNRSVKRTHKTPGSTYNVVSTLDDVYDLIANTDLDMLMADDCLVGIWITNKPAVRDLVLGEDGIFDIWGLQLEQEWLWLKTTVSGEPVTPIDALWRKPYEVLLLGRKRRFQQQAPQPVERKVLLSVPDLHSRKPCLKELVEPLFFEDYRALEVFARHLVAGWWSWGDECVKFNWDGYWLDTSNEATLSKTIE